LPSGLQSLTIGRKFDHCEDNVSLSHGLQSLTCKDKCGQCLDCVDNVSLPSD
jgi:hypothetical protein